MNQSNAKYCGYYTVFINAGEGRQMPFNVFATSDYHAAKIVRDKTGFLAHAHDVSGPYIK